MRIQRGDKRDRAKHDPFILVRPFIIGIGGAHSKVGKTTIACQILKRLNGWGAIKYTKTSFYSSIVDTPETLRQENKDTSRLMNAGAQNVLWVQSPREGLQDILDVAIDRLSHVQGIVLEGNSAVEALKPDVIIFVAGNGEIKRGAEKMVGDRYVMEAMRAAGAVLGGEDSGHMILAEQHTTGDGILSALLLVDAVCSERQPLSQLKKIMTPFPQVLVNITVTSKPDLADLPEFERVIRDVQEQLGENGRVFVRYSGTEPLCRVMVEGRSQEAIEAYANAIASSIAQALG